MLLFVFKAAVSGLLIAAVSTLGRRNPTIGALVAALPLVSIIAMLWLWHDTHDRVRLGQLSGSTFWYVLPSLPMFLIIPAALRAGLGFYPALAIGCGVSIALYLVMSYVGPRLGINL